MNYGEGPASDGSCYYSRLGIRKTASTAEIRAAYRKLALRWHPDKFAKNPSAAGEAKRRFQKIQEAYSVLSDDGKRAMYDAGIYDPFDEDDQDFSDFMQEMISMMDRVRPEKPDSFEDLQRMLEEMVNDNCTGSGSSNVGTGRRVPADNGPRRTKNCW